MPREVTDFITPRDRQLLAQARRRGGQKAVEKLAWALSGRIVGTMEEKERIREAMMADETDFAWPPARFLKPTPLPKEKERNEDRS
jgi:hypothetical protein